MRGAAWIRQPTTVCAGHIHHFTDSGVSIMLNCCYLHLLLALPPHHIFNLGQIQYMLPLLLHTQSLAKSCKTAHRTAHCIAYNNNNWRVREEKTVRVFALGINVIFLSIALIWEKMFHLKFYLTQTSISRHCTDYSDVQFLLFFFFFSSSSSCCCYYCCQVSTLIAFLLLCWYGLVLFWVHIYMCWSWFNLIREHRPSW